MFAGATAYTNAYFGQGSGPIFMDSVSCGSSDTALLACSYDPNTSENNHGKDAGVRCGGDCSNSYKGTDLGFEKGGWEGGTANGSSKTSKINDIHVVLN